jgi:hypothetical protein
VPLLLAKSLCEKFCFYYYTTVAKKNKEFFRQITVLEFKYNNLFSIGIINEIIFLDLEDSAVKLFGNEFFLN